MNIKTNDAAKCDLALKGLYDVIDPELDLNIVDLGLVYRIDFGGADGNIVVTMTLTTRFCPMGESIVDGTRQAMQRSFPGNGIQINLVFDPVWEPNMISGEGLLFLNS